MLWYEFEAIIACYQVQFHSCMHFDLDAPLNKIFFSPLAAIKNC